MGNIMKISVIIATFNRCQFLKGCLDSLTVQTCDKSFDFEVIVADNNSHDDTKLIVESYVEKFNGKLKYIFESKQGKSYALNKAIKEAKGEILAFTDDDVIVDKRWLYEINKIFKNPEVGIAGGIINPIWLAPKPKWVDENLCGALAVQNYGAHPFITSAPEKVPYGANFCFRKKLFTNYGLFNEKLTHTHDTEICKRFLKMGTKLGYSPNIVVFHKIDATRLKKKYFYNWFYKRGKLGCHRGTYKRKIYHVFGIPAWMILKAISEFLNSLGPFKGYQQRFLHRCHFLFNLGRIIGYFKRIFCYE